MRKLPFFIITLAFATTVLNATIGLDEAYVRFKRAYFNLVALTRPAWDKPNGSFSTVWVNHGFIDAATSCPLHGMKPRSEPLRVFDVFLFSSELEILLVRLHTLKSVVHRHVLVESNETFTLEQKPLYFQENRARFRQFDHRVHHEIVQPKPRKKLHEGMFRTHFARALNAAGIQSGDLVLLADVDEIPNAETVDLLRWCIWPAGVHRVHLSLTIYWYDFRTFSPWAYHDRASMNAWAVGGVLTHSQDYEAPLLGDSGWHCSWCFRTISEYKFKMASYSHSDRYPAFRRHAEYIQHAICIGDVLGYVPEEHEWSKLVGHIAKPFIRLYSTRYMPEWLRTEGRHIPSLSFLLGDNCTRDVE